jgi:hypothetical protein
MDNIKRAITGRIRSLLAKTVAAGMTLEEAEAEYRRDCQIALGIEKMEQETGRVITREEYLRAQKH